MIDLLLLAVALILILASPHPTAGLVGGATILIAVPLRMKMAEWQFRARRRRANLWG